MIIEAKFIGKNLSLGYEKNKSYRLIANTLFCPSYPVVISRVDKTGVCPYSTLEKFLENWTDIKSFFGLMNDIETELNTKQL